MVLRNDPNPAVSTFVDHEVITPTHDLRSAIMHAGEADGDHGDPVARAEAALAELSSQFGDWMNAECDRLETARREVRRLGFSSKTHAELFRAAHDIRGEAATFGFPAAGEVADSLCRLVEHTPEMTRIPLGLVDQHVDAVRAIAREHARADFAAIAAELTRRLRQVTDEFLRVENSTRPDYLESIFAPPIAS